MTLTLPARAAWCVFKRETRGYFATPLAYVLLAVFLALAGFLTFRNDFFLTGQASLGAFFGAAPQLLLIFAPALAMRLWSEERKTNTLELLFSLPITTGAAVVGKFFAAWFVLGIALALTFPMVVTVAYLGAPDYGPIIGGYLATALLAGAFVALGGFFSALTRNQVIAFVLGVSGCGALYYLGSPALLRWLTLTFSANVAEVGALFSLQQQFEFLQRGAVEISAVLFFIIFIAGGLWANALVLDNQR